MNKKEIVFGLAVALVLGTFISIFASSSPDGLEKVAENKGFLRLMEAKPPSVKAPIPDYAWPGVESEAAACALAGLTGTLLTFGVMYAIGKWNIRS